MRSADVFINLLLNVSHILPTMGAEAASGACPSTVFREEMMPIALASYEVCHKFSILQHPAPTPRIASMSL